MTGTKTITFAVPCYNSAEYMDKCIESLLACGNDVEILIIDDGSTKDNTAEKADEWQNQYPSIIRAIHKENGGHGSGVNTGLANARGRYFKVVDSDDWLDYEAMKPIMAYLRIQCELKNPTDLVIGNYVYEKVYEGKSIVMHYRGILPVEKQFTWDEVGRFPQSQVLLMHSVIYRTDLLRDSGIKLPEHTFYVDNIFVYVPLIYVKTIYYFDVDMYRYFIGREGQSVNESIMISRIDQQLRITRIMIDAIDFETLHLNKKLQAYMENYLAMMMCICSIFLRMQNAEDSDEKRAEIWNYLENKDPHLHKRIKNHIINLGTNIPSEFGRRIGIGGYHIAQKIFKFN